MNSSSPTLTQKPSVSLVIPGRNCAKTLEKCLDSVVPFLEQGGLQEILFVDDGSTDNTAEIARRYPVQVITGTGSGPGAARNLGWRQAQGEYIWFIDSDCVAEPDALQKLIPHLDNPEVAGVGGSYANLYPDSLLATLIHEEIIARHRRMPQDVNFLATFNVIYRQQVLEEVGGFDETLKLAQDAELAFRIVQAGYQLRFEIDSRVGHHHPRQLSRYLRTQARQGYYRVLLYRLHPGRMRGDSYAGISDYAQPPLAALSFAALPTCFVSGGWLVSTTLTMLLILLQIPVTVSLTQQAGRRMLIFPAFGCLRAYFRAAGMVVGACSQKQRASKKHSSGLVVKCCKYMGDQ